MKTSVKALLATLLAISFVSMTFAEPKVWQVQAFEQFDANSDRALDRSEFTAQRIAMAKQVARKNSKEFDEVMWKAFAERLFPKTDTDGDGRISPAEFYTSFNAK